MSSPALTLDIVVTEILPAIIIANIGWIVGANLISKDVKLWYEKVRKAPWIRFVPSADSPLAGCVFVFVYGMIGIICVFWTASHILLGIGSWLVYHSGSGYSGTAGFPLVLYSSQLLLNCLWTPIIFKLNRPGLALVDISALWVNTIACIVTFYSVNKIAAGLLIPYLVWVSFATALTHSIWRNSPNHSYF